jgi:hypothetical protein
METADLHLSQSSQSVSSNDAIELEKLKVRVEWAIADRRISRYERDDIIRIIYADRRVSVEECEVLRLLQEKIWQGEIQID